MAVRKRPTPATKPALIQAEATIEASKNHARVVRQDRRAVIHSEAVKSLFWLNGGSAIALLAFLQGIWKDAPSLVPFILGGLIILAIGVAIAARVNFIHHASALAWEGWFTYGNEKQRAEGMKLSGIFQRLGAASLGCFLVAVFIIILGAAQNAPTD